VKSSPSIRLNDWNGFRVAGLCDQTGLESVAIRACGGKSEETQLERRIDLGTATVTLSSSPRSSLPPSLPCLQATPSLLLRSCSHTIRGKLFRRQASDWHIQVLFQAKTAARLLSSLRQFSSQSDCPQGFPIGWHFRRVRPRVLFRKFHGRVWRTRCTSSVWRRVSDPPRL
jgi:hypothetical protein